MVDGGWWMDRSADGGWIDRRRPDLSIAGPSPAALHKAFETSRCRRSGASERFVLLAHREREAEGRQASEAPAETWNEWPTGRAGPPASRAMLRRRRLPDCFSDARPKRIDDEEEAVHC
eukprot:scaffold334_cov241-Pinguiococcus_pyrenoidosus.AAC.48